MRETIKNMSQTIGINKLGPQHPLRKWVVTALALAGFFFIVSLFFPKPLELEYLTQTLQKKPLTILVSTTGNLEPTEQVDVGSEVSGTIAELFVDFDDRVTKDQLLAKIDTTKLEASLKSSKATLLQAQASLLEAEATLLESKNAYLRSVKIKKSSNGIRPTPKEMDSSIAAYERAKARKLNADAQILQAQAALEMDQYNLKKAVILSPIEGIVLDRKVDAGQTIASTLQTPILFTIAKDLKQMKLIVSIDEADVGLILPDQKASFTVDAHNDEKFSATITKVRLNGKELNGVVTYEAELIVENNDLLLRPGMTATTNIVVKEVPKGFIVPNNALRFKPENEELLTGKEKQESHIWVLKDDKPLYKKIIVGPSDGSFTSISSSELQEDDEVIIKSKKVTK